ncbi:MAG: hypothetical protein ACUVUU_02715 [bacterium]
MTGSVRKIRFLAALIAIVILLPSVAQVLEQEPRTTDETSLSESGKNSLTPPKSLHGKRERRLFRLENWVKSLKDDMKTVYETYGIPSSRYREESMGRVVEKWTYLDKGLEFTFQDAKIISQRRISGSSFKVVF